MNFKIILITVISFLAVAVTLSFKNKGRLSQVIISSGGDNKEKAAFEVELAENALTRAKGLMFRKNLDENKGMLFIFKEESEHSFWMKNTFITLDMVFADKNGVIVGIIENAEPQSVISLTIAKPSKYVLEINGGLCEKYGIVEGDLMKISNF